MFPVNNDTLRKLSSSKGAFAELVEVLTELAKVEQEAAQSLAVSALLKPELVGAAQRQFGRSEALKDLAETFNSYLGA